MEKQFKQDLGKSIADLSVCMSTSMQQIDMEVLKKMVKTICEIIETESLPKEITYYLDAIRGIKTGEHHIYNLTVVSLMQVFRNNFPKGYEPFQVNY